MISAYRAMKRWRLDLARKRRKAWGATRVEIAPAVARLRFRRHISVREWSSLNRGVSP